METKGTFKFFVRPSSDSEMVLFAFLMQSRYDHLRAKGHPFSSMATTQARPHYDWLVGLRKHGGLFSFIDSETQRPLGIVGFSIGPLWWANGALMLQEEIIMGHPEYSGFGRIAVDWLLNKAVAEGCVAVEAGSAFADDQEHQQLENLYTKKYGFQHSYRHFTKVLGGST